jgi:hypothetical protein
MQQGIIVYVHAKGCGREKKQDAGLRIAVSQEKK